MELAAEYKIQFGWTIRLHAIPNYGVQDTTSCRISYTRWPPAPVHQDRQ